MEQIEEVEAVEEVEVEVEEEEEEGTCHLPPFINLCPPPSPPPPLHCQIVADDGQRCQILLYDSSGAVLSRSKRRTWS